MKVFVGLLLAAVATFALADQVCYQNIGCFTNDPPFDLLPLPQDPNQYPPVYYLHQKGKAVKTINSSQSLAADVIFLAHGFTEDYPTSSWATNMVAKLHEVRPNADVIFVDWGKLAAMGSGSRVYTQAASNSRSAGASLAFFLDSNTKLDTSKYYCIGFSLGSHVCGFAGKRLNKKWGRITALDPAGPGFSERSDLSARVATTDAQLLDVVHVSMVGLYFAMGHVDFWVNDAKQQPGCSSKIIGDTRDLTDISQFFSCSHLRAPPLFIETINPGTGCAFPFCPCSSWLNVQLGKCKTCDTKVSQQLGYKADLSSNRGEFYGNTGSAAPFCLT